MKLLRYCYGLDLNLDDNRTEHFGNNSVHGFIINETYIAVSVDGFNDLFCLLGKNDEETELTQIFALSFAKNMSMFIKDTVGIAEHRVIDKRRITSLVQMYPTTEMFTNDCNTDKIDSFPLHLYKDYGKNVCHIVMGNKCLFSLNNEQAGKQLFEILRNDLLSYIQARW